GAAFVIGALRRVRSEMLGLNRRNHAYLFAYNPRAGYRVVDDKQATKSALSAGAVAVRALRDVCDAQWRVRGVMARRAAEREFVLKPARGAGGAGIVVVVDRQDERFVKASGAMLRARDLEAHACDVLAGTYSSGGRTDRLLVEELVVPEPVVGALSWRGVGVILWLVFPGVLALTLYFVPIRHQ